MQDFDQFLKEREAAARAFVSGDGTMVAELSANNGAASFFDPGGGITTGAGAVNNGNIEGARDFATGGSTRFEIIDKGSSQDLAFWTGIQRATCVLASGGQSVDMALRVTETFRRVGDRWKMVHRHASPLKET